LTEAALWLPSMIRACLMDRGTLGVAAADPPKKSMVTVG
jgi:hypothetical protein